MIIEEINTTLDVLIEDIMDNKELTATAIKDLKQPVLLLFFKLLADIEELISKSISKDKVKEIIKKICSYEKLANEQIENEVIIACSDSLNFGRKQAHCEDKRMLEELLKERE